MQDGKGCTLYIGKAKNLKKRVGSYFRQKVEPKIQEMVAQVANIEITVTRNEREALLLENNLIKQYQPKYNVLFKDDKSYPFIAFSSDKPFARLFFHRGAKGKKLELFGPFPSSNLVRSCLNLLQKAFLLRQCDNTFFKHRTRPCLQYQIKRCSAPCVGYISENQYEKQVQKAKAFLKGETSQVMQELTLDMKQASSKHDYENAALLRDQLRYLRQVQDQQIILGTKGRHDLDVIGVAYSLQYICLHVLSLREGSLIGSRQFKLVLDSYVKQHQEKIIETFLCQHYLEKEQRLSYPKVIVMRDFKQIKNVEALLQEQLESEITLQSQVKAKKLMWLEMAESSANKAIQAQEKQNYRVFMGFESLARRLNLSTPLEKIVCFDVSHFSGKQTVSSAVVFTGNGPLKEEYRRFNIHQAKASDDYEAIYETIVRFLTHYKEKDFAIPDLLLIDGGKGQLNKALCALRDCQVEGVIVLGIAKGEGRKREREKIILAEEMSLVDMEGFQEAFHLLQVVRDEAHRFAISGHRKKRKKESLVSPLSQISGVGEKKRLLLLEYFGGLQEIKAASLKQLSEVPGISQKLAERIYARLHGTSNEL